MSGVKVILLRFDKVSDKIPKIFDKKKSGFSSISLNTVLSLDKS